MPKWNVSEEQWDATRPLTITPQRTFTVEELLTYLLSFGAFLTFNAEDYGNDVELLMEAWLYFNRSNREAANRRA